MISMGNLIFKRHFRYFQSGINVEVGFDHSVWKNSAESSVIVQKYASESEAQEVQQKHLIYLLTYMLTWNLVPRQKPGII